jgi:DNA-binding CsgD family transcriptional regulator
MAREQGELDRAAALYERSLKLQRKIANTRGIALALLNLGVVALDGGSYARSVAMIAESVELFEALGDKSLGAVALTALGYAVLHQGDPWHAAATQSRCLRLAHEAGDKRGVAYGLEGIAAAIALQGAGAQGAQLAARLYGATEALRQELELPIPPADHALNERSIAAARATLGETAFAMACAAGRALPLEEAINEALAMGESTPLPERTVLAEVTPSRLSQREQQVAALAACGHTNRQIAEELHVSIRTADKHVSNILRKLGLSSRAQLEPWLAELGLIRDV